MSLARSFDAFLSSTPTIKELTEHVDVSTNWYIVGTLLDLDQRRLRSIIEGQTGHTNTHKMIEMFNLWLTTTPTASRRQVLEALRISVVGENTLADKYEKHLKKLHETNYTPPSTEAVLILQANIQSLNEALVSPVQVSQLLYCKRCISEVTLDEMERIDESRSLDDKKTTLLTGMQETVSSDYRKLKDIATVLSDVEETRDMANEMMTKYEEKIPQEDDSTVQPQEVAGSNEDRASDILRNNYSALSQSITNPVRVAKWLHEEVISDEALSCVMSTRGSVSQSRAVLLKAVRDAVHSNYKHLELFVTVLRKFSGTAHIGDTIFEKYSQYFCDEDNTIEEMETYLTERRSLRAATSAESGSECGSSKGEVKEILGSHKILFPRSMEEKFQELRIKFGSTFFKVRRNFAKDQNLSIDEMKLLVIDCFPDLSSQVFNKETINEVLEVVKTRCNIINMRPLEVLTEELNIKEAEEVIKIYKKFAEDFCKSTSIQLCLDKELKAVPSPSPLKKETITFILEWNPNESTLQDINDVLKKLEPLENYFIQIDTIKTGRSVVVTCYCPAEYTGSLIMAVLDKIDILQEKRLKEFKVGNCTIWNNAAHEVAPGFTIVGNCTLWNKNYMIMGYSQDLEGNKAIKDHCSDEEKELLQQQKEDDEDIKSQEKFEAKQRKEMLSELNEELKKMNRAKNLEIENLKATIKKKDERIFACEEQMQLLQKQTQKEEEEEEEEEEEGTGYFPHKGFYYEDDDDYDDYDYGMSKPQEMHFSLTEVPESTNIDQLLKLRERKELGSVIIDKHDTVKLYDVSIKQCQELIVRIEGKHSSIEISRSTPDIPLFLMPALLRMRSICSIQLSFTQLESDAIRSFSDQLSHNRTLETLHVRNNSINDDGVIALAQSLKHNSTLSRLYLDQNPGITSACVQSLAELLLTNNTLSRLNLQYNSNIDSNGIVVLMETLKTNKTLQAIILNEYHRKQCSSLPYYDEISRRISFFDFFAK